MKTAYKLLALAAAALALYPFSSTRAADPSNGATHGIAVANMDRAVLPGNDFYDYANGSWIKRAVIPPDRARIGVFSQLDDLTNKRTAALIEEAAKSNAAAGSSERKIA
ncbi:MAG TPA: M13 family peptidase, partial [Candidatus Angelobacter sp.]|nr:M13 family peptidase [Candidatus Angelobacter sp.]